LYTLLKKAQNLAMAKIRPGVMISKIDQAARRLLNREGYGKYFIHNLGHGVGLDTHELPFISPKNKERLKRGMAFTIEPGIYIPGWGGLRREDMVAVAKDGCEVL
ncbi:MAG: M24 family metallopeptidase, partial [Candidatus Omnitrophica bacterium]|nr:M24 family metallopeptidase [Candidatus Omnitrophota bacterium]